MLLTLLLACALAPLEEPASLVIDGPQTVTITSHRRMVWPRAQALDAEGKPLAKQPKVTWTVEPDGLANNHDGELSPNHNGNGRVVAHVGELTASYELIILIPTSVAVVDPPAHLVVGQPVRIKGQAYVDAAPVDSNVSWTSSTLETATVDNDGNVSPVAPGEARLTAHAGMHTDDVVLTVLPAGSALAQSPRDPDLITASPIAEAERLTPCSVVLTHTEYNPETKDPTTTRQPVTRLLRRWHEDLRRDDWHGVAPIALTRAQALALLPSPTAYEHNDGVFATVADGLLSYAFDAEGRTTKVGWDPTADSSDYDYSYAYDCPAGSRSPTYSE